MCVSMQKRFTFKLVKIIIFTNSMNRELREMQTSTDDILRIIDNTDENNFQFFSTNLFNETGIRIIKKEWKPVILQELNRSLEENDITQTKFNLVSQLLDLNIEQDKTLGGRKSRRNRRYRRRRSRRYK